MAIKSGQISYKGQQISVKTLAKDVTVEDPNNKFVSSNLEDVLVEVLSSTDASNKVDKVAGMGLSEADYTLAEKNKLASIEDGANNYVHPITHAPSIIQQDANNRFVTDAQMATWNAGATSSDIQSVLSSAKGYTDSSITSLKGGVTTNLNTLYKIALAINNDPNYDSNIKSYINSKIAGASGTAVIEIQAIDELSSYAVKVGDIINIVTYTNLFYKCTDINGSTFATKFTSTAAQDLASCTLATSETTAMGLTVTVGQYIYIPQLASIVKTYICVSDDVEITDFNQKYKILLPEGYVENKLTELIDGAPNSLDTLNELAAALGDDANFATTMTNALSAINTNITNLTSSIATLTSTTNSKFNTVNTSLTNLQNSVNDITTRVTSLESSSVSNPSTVMDGGTF